MKIRDFRYSLSNKFNNTYNTQNAGITFRHGDRDNMISAGVSYQFSELKSDQVFPHIGQIDNTYSNFLGNVFSRFKLSSKSNLRIIYRGSVSAPSVTQLQNVIDNTNQFFYTTGNPESAAAVHKQFDYPLYLHEQCKRAKFFCKCFRAERLIIM